MHEGQYLNAGERVASLVDASHLKLNFSLDEQVAPQLSTHQPINIAVDAYPNQTFTGSLNAIDLLLALLALCKYKPFYRIPITN